MVEGMRNTISCTIDDSTVNLRTATDILLCLRQKNTAYFEYNGTVIDAHTFSAVMPKEDAMKLKKGQIDMQVLFTDENGNPRHTAIRSVTVDEILREAGYGD